MIVPCPECHENTPETAMVRVEITLTGGDDNAGSSSSAFLGVCGACGKALLGKYIGLAVAEQVRRAEPPK